jgi:acetyltransferase-like isoleucine patch superfamily enzyme
MSKTFLSKIKFFFKKIRYKKQGVIIYHDSFVANVNFKGKAVIEPFCRISGTPSISIGNNFYLNCGGHFLGEITIGDNVMIGPKTVIWGRDHGTEYGTPMNQQLHMNEPVSIGDDVWIGANVTILKGVTVGCGVVVGAGSVVVKDIPDYAIVVGNPARVVKFREYE